MLSAILTDVYIKQTEWRIWSEFICVERLMFVVQYRLSVVIYQKRGKQWVSQQCGWQCVTNTQRHLLGVCSTKIDCASSLSFSHVFSPVFVLSPSLLSFPLLHTEEDVRCQNKNEMLEGAKEEKWSVCLLVGCCPDLLSKKFVLPPPHLSIAHKSVKNLNADMTPAQVFPSGPDVEWGESMRDFQKVLFNIQKYITNTPPWEEVKNERWNLRRPSLAYGPLLMLPAEIKIYDMCRPLREMYEAKLLM